MNVSLTPELEEFVLAQVQAGRYRSASEVVRDALRLLEGRLAERKARLAVLRRALREGIEELERSESVDGEKAFDRILSDLRRAEGAA